MGSGMNREIPKECEYIEGIPTLEATTMKYCKTRPSKSCSVNDLSPLYTCTRHSIMFRESLSKVGKVKIRNV
jgi:hypothetical protein